MQSRQSQAIPPTKAEVSQLPRVQLTSLYKDTLKECILSFKGGEGEGIKSLERKLETICNDLTDVKNKLSSPDSAINKKLEMMQQQIDKQADIIVKQQKFLESIDRKERENRLVVLGVPEDGESLAGATDDEAKLKKILSEMSEELPPCTHHRLGQEATDRKKRPILVTLASRTEKERILSKTKRLKDAGEPFSRIYIKKDVHPQVRNEWKRLRTAETEEKNKPENVGHVIRLDFRTRVLYRDDVEIDRFNPTPF